MNKKQLKALKEEVIVRGDYKDEWRNHVMYHFCEKRNEKGCFFCDCYPTSLELFTEYRLTRSVA